MKNKKIISKLSFSALGGLFLVPALFLPFIVHAYTIENLPNVKIESDFTVGPTQNEIYLAPGEKTIRNLMVTSRIGSKMKFEVTTEDFKGSETGDMAAVLLGLDKGPYSLFDYLKPEVKEFSLEHGQRMVLPVEISVPKDAEPGGRYGAVLVSVTSADMDASAVGGEAGAAVRIKGRVAALYFVRVKGEAQEGGFLKEVRALKNARTRQAQKFFETGPVAFEVLFQNTGNVHLDPYGAIEVKNILGKKVYDIELKPWFAMPDSLRSRIVEFQKSWMFGRYTATAKVNRGYKDIIDERSVVFWVLPWKVLLAIFAVIILIAILLKWIMRNFEIRKKVQS